MSGRSSEFDRTRNREVLGRESGRLRKNVEMLFAHTNALLSWTDCGYEVKGCPRRVHSCGNCRESSKAG